VSTVGDRTEELRERLGISAAELGRRAGIPGQTITNTVRGSRQRPDYDARSDTLAAIARAAKVSSLWLEKGIGSPDDPEGAAPSQPSPALERDPATRVPEEHETPLETAVVELFRAPELKHLRAQDLEAAVEAVRQSYRHMAPDADLAATARAYLVAAYQLRAEGKDADPMAVVARAAGSRNQLIQARLDAVDAADLADADEAHRASGLPDNGAEVQRLVAERMKKRRGG
jgi:transcriptional regulator with XRE-family HTH domain